MDSDEDEIFENDLDILEIIEFGFPRKTLTRRDYFIDMDDLTFFRRFRLMKETVLRILELIEADLEFPHDLNHSVSPINQLLATLRFYSSSGHLASVADFSGMAISSTSRIIKKVSYSLAGLYNRFVKMPRPEEIIRVQTDFFRMASFPRVIGAIDGTHIRIQSPGGADAEVFRNRKGFFSVNTQIICNANLKLLDVVARWPGSAHDNTIFLNSLVRRNFENGIYPNCILIADSGYAQKNYLVTPVADPITREQMLYNESLVRTRNTVERTIGVWKRRFPVLAYGLRLKINTILAVIPATAVLHNIALAMNEPEPPPAYDINMDELNYLIEVGNIPDVPVQANIGYQNVLVNEYFDHL